MPVRADRPLEPPRHIACRHPVAQDLKRQECNFGGGDAFLAYSLSFFGHEETMVPTLNRHHLVSRFSIFVEACEIIEDSEDRLGSHILWSQQF